MGIGIKTYKKRSGIIGKKDRWMVNITTDVDDISYKRIKSKTKKKKGSKQQQHLFRW